MHRNSTYYRFFVACMKINLNVGHTLQLSDQIVPFQNDFSGDHVVEMHRQNAPLLTI